MADAYSNNLPTSNTYSDDDAYAVIPSITMQYINQQVAAPIDPSTQIPNLSIVSAMIADLTITGAKIANATIYTANIQDAAITTLKVADASITNAKIDRATVNKLVVTNADILDATIQGAKIAQATIDGANIKQATIDTANIKTGAITTALLGTAVVDTAQIKDGSITAAKIVSLNADVITAGTLSVNRLLIKGANSVIYEINAQASGLTTQQLTDAQYQSAINGSVIVADSITAREIAASTITANEIAANTITTDKLNVVKLSAISADLGNVTAGSISGVSITSTASGTTTNINGGEIKVINPNTNGFIGLKGKIITISNTNTIDDQTTMERQGSDFVITSYSQTNPATIQLNTETLVVNGKLTANNDISGGTIYMGNWFRSKGNSGWYNQDYGGGIYQDENSYWVKVYGNKGFMIPNGKELSVDTIVGSTRNQIYLSWNAYGFIDVSGGAARFQYDNNSYVAITASNTTIYAGGRGVFSAMVGDNGSTHSFLQGQGSGIQLLGGGGVQARNAANNAYVQVYGTGFTPSSVREEKKNIVPFMDNATELVKGTPVYNYNYNNELDTELPHTGIMLDEAPVWLADVRGLGIDLYAMVSVLWKSNQELAARVELLEAG